MPRGKIYLQAYITSKCTCLFPCWYLLFITQGQLVFLVFMVGDPVYTLVGWLAKGITYTLTHWHMLI